MSSAATQTKLETSAQVPGHAVGKLDESPGVIAGGAVRVTINGVGDLINVEIASGGFDASDPDDLSDLGDMIVAAYRDAKGQADALAADALGPFSGGGMPGLGG